MNYYPFHIGDYAAHTAHLEPLEDLAYRRVLDLYYLRDGAIPQSPADVAKLVRMRSNVAEVESVLREFFLQTDEGWSNKRCDEEIARFSEKREKARASGLASAYSRKARDEVMNQADADVRSAAQDPSPSPPPTDVQRTFNERSTTVQRVFNSHNHNHNQNQEPKEEPRSKALCTLRVQVPTAEKPADGAHRLQADLQENDESEGESGVGRAGPPPCPIAKVVELYHEVLPELPRIERITEARRSHIRQRWREWAKDKRWQAQSDGVDEWRKFFAYVRRSDFLMGRVNPREQGRTPFVADLDWLMRPGNNVKVYEGKYHGDS